MNYHSHNWLAYIMGCHQIPNRSFKINGKPMPICARCLGICLGHILVLIPLILIKVSFLYVPLGIILIIPATLDAFTQYRGKRESNNYLRLITGMMGGVGYLLILFIFISTILLAILHILGINITSSHF